MIKNGFYLSIFNFLNDNFFVKDLILANSDHREYDENRKRMSARLLLDCINCTDRREIRRVYKDTRRIDAVGRVCGKNLISFPSFMALLNERDASATASFYSIYHLFLLLSDIHRFHVPTLIIYRSINNIQDLRARGKN